MSAIIIGIQVWLATVMVILKMLPYSSGKVETKFFTGKCQQQNMLVWILGEEECKNHFQEIPSR